MEINTVDFESKAAKLLDTAVYDFFYGGSSDEITLKENNEAYKKIKLLPKVLRGVENPDTNISLFNQNLAMPILVAPMAFQKLCHPEGELATARGVEQANTMMVVSNYSTSAFKEIVAKLRQGAWNSTIRNKWNYIDRSFKHYS